MPMIIGEIRRYLRDNNPIRVSRSMRDLAYKALRMRDTLTYKNGVEPGFDEIAKALHVPREDVVTALEAIQSPISLFEPVFQEGGDAVCVMDQVKDPRVSDGDWIRSLSLEQALEHLSERERSIILSRYFDGRTQMEVASEIGISQAQVSRLEKSALKQMRRYV